MRRPADRIAPTPCRDRRGGYITVVVLTFAGLMAALVAATLNVARPSIGQALVNIDDMQAEALLDAGVQAAGYALYGDRKRSYQEVSGMVLPLQTGAVRVTVLPEGGRVDLNGAPPQLLAGIYAVAGTGALNPQEFAGMVIDWRDGNNKARPHGAEKQDYSGKGLDYGPRNGPFLSIEELLLLPGMTQEDYAALTPYLTIYNPIGDLDPAGAEITALMAVPEMSEAAAVEIKQTFEDPDAKRSDLNQVIRPYRRYLSTETSNVFRVIVEARLNDGYAKSVETVLMGGMRRSPYNVLYWRVLDAPKEAT